MTMKESSVQY